MIRKRKGLKMPIKIDSDFKEEVISPFILPPIMLANVSREGWGIKILDSFTIQYPLKKFKYGNMWKCGSIHKNKEHRNSYTSFSLMARELLKNKEFLRHKTGENQLICMSYMSIQEDLKMVEIWYDVVQLIKEVK